MSYAVLNLFFLVPAAAVSIAAGALLLRCRGTRRAGEGAARPALARAGIALAATALALLALTAVFDTVMISAGLFSYAPGSLSGVFVGRAPLEDFAYPLAAALLLPALWWLLRDGSATLRALLLTSRPLSWVNTAYPFAAAYLVAGGRIGPEWILGTLYFLIPYNLAMYGINDVFDYESDVRNPRKGGVEGAVLGRGLHRATLVVAAASNVPFLAFLALSGGAASGIVLAVSVFAVIAYSAPRLRFKERPFLDSATSSTHFLSPAVFGAVLAGAHPTPGLLALFGAFFLWGAASQAFGSVQDIGADREGGIRSIGTALGARATVRLSVAGYAAAGLLLLATPWPGPLAAVIPAGYALNAWPFRSLPDARAELANTGWRRFLRLNFAAGFLVTMLLIWHARMA